MANLGKKIRDAITNVLGNPAMPSKEKQAIEDNFPGEGISGMAKRNRGEFMTRHPKGSKGFVESDMKRYATDMSNESEKADDVTGDSMPLDEAMREVHKKIPKNVVAMGKTGAAKEAMLRAIAYSKSGRK